MPDRGEAPVQCSFCGTTPALTRPIDEGVVSPGLCSACLIGIIRGAAANIELLSGDAYDLTPVAGPGDGDEVLWEQFDCAMHTNSVLGNIANLIASEQATVDYQWDGGPIDRPVTTMVSDLERVRSLLNRNGYREVSVVSGNASELVAQHRLGRFYARYDEDGRSHWTTKVVFAKGDP